MILGDAQIYNSVDELHLPEPVFLWMMLLNICACQPIYNRKKKKEKKRKSKMHNEDEARPIILAQILTS